MKRRYDEYGREYLFRSRRTAIAWALVGWAIAMTLFVAVALVVLWVGRNL